MLPTGGAPDACHPVTADLCTAATCEAKVPDCPDGTIQEVEGDCYTGYCVPAEVCGDCGDCG